MQVNSDAIEKLTRLRNEVKFGEMTPNDRKPIGYVGLLPRENQPMANELLNQSIDRLIIILKDHPTKNRILNEYKRGLESLDDIASDSEDRERVCDYYDEIREIIGFDSTDEILNNWL